MCDVAHFPIISYNNYFISLYFFSSLFEFFEGEEEEEEEEEETAIGQTIVVSTAGTLIREVSASDDADRTGQLFLRIIGVISSSPVSILMPIISADIVSFNFSF